MTTPIRSAFSVEGEGAPIFLIHGIGASRALLRRSRGTAQETSTAASAMISAATASPRCPRPPYTLEDLVEDLEALASELGIEKAHFAGHSLGGMIGPAYARKYPQHVATASASIRPPPSAPPTTAPRSKAWLPPCAAKGIPQVLETLKDRWFTPEFAQRRPDVIERRMQQVIDTDPDVFLSVFDIYAETEMSPWLHEVKHPCLVLTGENDGGCNPRLNRADRRRALPDSELVILPVLRHAILLEASEQVAPPVLDFLRRHRMR